MGMLSQELENSLNAAFQGARDRRHEYITVEHLLMALLDNATASRVLRACGGDMDDLRSNMDAFLKDSVPVLPSEGEVETQPTLGFQRVIQRAVLHIQGAGKKEVTGANVLVAIFAEKESHAVFYLHKQNITRFDVVNFISHGISKLPEDNQNELPAPDEADETTTAPERSPLDVFTVNLNERAREGKIDPLIGDRKSVV